MGSALVFTIRRSFEAYRASLAPRATSQIILTCKTRENALNHLAGGADEATAGLADCLQTSGMEPAHDFILTCSTVEISQNNTNWGGMGCSNTAGKIH